MYDISYVILCIFYIDFFTGNVFGSVTGNVLRNRVHTLKQAITGVEAVFKVRKLRGKAFTFCNPYFADCFIANHPFSVGFNDISVAFSNHDALRK